MNICESLDIYPVDQLLGVLYHVKISYFCKRTASLKFRHSLWAGRHSTEVAFTLRARAAQVRIMAPEIFFQEEKKLSLSL